MIRLGILTSLFLALSTTFAAAQAVSAVLEPVRFVEITSAVAGRISDLSVAEGQDVTEGTPLARIDASVQEARVALSRIAAEAQGATQRAAIVVAQAESLAKRVRAARAKGAAQAWEVTQVTQALELAKADQQIAVEAAAQLEAQLALEDATLSEFAMSAPFDGTVLEVMVEQGQIIDTQTIALAFGNLDRLSATAFLPVSWVTSLNVGEPLPATLENSNRRVDARVTAIDPRIDPASQSVRVKVEIANPDRRVFAGSVLLLEQN